MKWIDNIITELIKSVGSNNIYEILNYLNIFTFPIDPDNIILQGNIAIYNHINNFKCIYYSTDIKNKEYVFAHEIGHALLHPEDCSILFNGSSISVGGAIFP